MSVRNGKPVNSGRAMTPRNVPQHGIDAGPEHALWPNQSHRKSVSTKASLVGQHHVTGDGLPDSMQFDLGRDHDFLPELELDRETDRKRPRLNSSHLITSRMTSPTGTKK